MGKYGVFFNDFATATTTKTAVGLHANAAGEEGELVELLMTGSGTAAAADRQHRCQGAGCTFATAGTGTVITAQPFNANSPAARVLATGEFSVEPTVVGTVFPILFGFNQRGGMRWAVPQGEGLRFNNDRTEKGVVGQVLSDAAGAIDGHAHWWEP